MKKIKAVSLFSSSGIGELNLNKIGIEVVCANEILEKRALCYSFFFPKTQMIQGDIRDNIVRERIKKCIKQEKPELLIATPPCQGLSSVGRNKNQEEYINDQRNFLIFDILEVIDTSDFKYVLIENVPRYLKMLFPYKNKLLTLEEILREKYRSIYEIKIDIFDAKNFGVAQTRPRAIVRMYKKNLTWRDPKAKKEITLKDAIGHLPSLEAGEKSKIKNHNAKIENSRYQLAMRHTPEGTSALKNEKYYPKNKKGERITGFHNTFKRMSWDKPACARTTYSGSISSHNNVHPGRRRLDGTYSDARVLTLLETFIVSSIPKNISFPDWASNTFIYTTIGEAIPPNLLKEILKPICK